ncbi:MAG: hypothetical protein L0H94_14420, partial [Nitrospira sp.]|nr:hypothetical protein [Nitrospira sp.]
ARLGKSIAKQSEGRAGEKYLPVGGRVRTLRALEDQPAPIPEKRTSEPGGLIVSWTRARKRSAKPLRRKSLDAACFLVEMGSGPATRRSANILSSEPRK